MSGKTKKNGLVSRPVNITRRVANVIAIDPSTTNFAGPSADDGSRSWTTRTKRLASASRTKMAGWASGQSPVTATIVDVAAMKTQLTIRTTRSYAQTGTSASADDASAPTSAASSSDRRSDSSSSRSILIGLVRPTRGGTRTAAMTMRFATTATMSRIRTGSPNLWYVLRAPGRRRGPASLAILVGRPRPTPFGAIAPGVSGAPRHREDGRAGVSEGSASAPLVGLLDHPQVHEGLRLADAVDGAQLLGQELEERLVVLADDLDEEVERPGSDDDVVDLREFRDRVGHIEETVALAPDADHRLLLEPELERVGDADDLEDSALDEPIRPGSHRGLRHPEVGRDLGEGPPAVLLEVLDDPLVECRDVVDPAVRGDASRRRGHGFLVAAGDGAALVVADGASDGRVVAWGTATGSTERRVSGPTIGSSAATSASSAARLAGSAFVGDGSFVDDGPNSTRMFMPARMYGASPGRGRVFGSNRPIFRRASAVVNWVITRGQSVYVALITLTGSPFAPPLAVLAVIRIPCAPIQRNTASTDAGAERCGLGVTTGVAAATGAGDGAGSPPHAERSAVTAATAHAARSPRFDVRICRPILASGSQPSTVTLVLAERRNRTVRQSWSSASRTGASSSSADGVIGARTSWTSAMPAAA